jgi:flagellar basal body-associated protein FliL
MQLKKQEGKMNSHFWKSKILVAIVIGLFSLMMFAEAIPSTAGSSSRQMAQGKGQNQNRELNRTAVKSQSTQAVAADKEEMAEGVKNAESQPQPTVKEHASTAPQVKKKKKFPWLLAIAALLVVGAAVYYFVVINKKYTLTTTVGTGVNGTPATGSVKYKRKSVVNYNYSPASGYTNLVVTLDGAAVAASGTLTMDKDHTLSATATESFVLTVAKNAGVNGTPETGTYTYASGASVSYNYSLASNYIDLVVKIDNAVATASGTIVMSGNHTLNASATFEDPNATYTLVVTFWNNYATGSPAQGTYHYSKGTIVNYDYYGTASYPYVSVYIDMVDTCFKKLPTHCTGTIVMDKDRSVGVQGGL